MQLNTVFLAAKYLDNVFALERCTILTKICFLLKLELKFFVGSRKAIIHCLTNL